MKNIVFFLTGVLFGTGMVISGMVDPARVIGFLDLAGKWDPSLAFVMGGALFIFMPGYILLIKPRQVSILGEQLPTVPAPIIDRSLLGGAILFGIGWGIAGICPGPALSLLVLFPPQLLLFTMAMIIGLLLADRLRK